MSRQKESTAIRRRRALAEVRRKRGYVLTYHRLMAELDPALLAAYDAFYTRMLNLLGFALMQAREELLAEGKSPAEVATMVNLYRIGRGSEGDAGTTPASA